MQLSSWAAACNKVTPSTGESEARQIDDEMVVNGILSGLRFLARHARDRAAARGNALVRAQLYPVGGQQPLRLTYNRGFGRGFGDSLGDRIMTDVEPPLERVAPLDALAADGPSSASGWRMARSCAMRASTRDKRR